MTKKLDTAPGIEVVGIKPLAYYDDISLANDIMWPLVDRHWPRGDFRMESQPGFDEVSIAMRGLYKGSMYDVALEAVKEEYNGDDGVETVATVTLEVGQTVSDFRRDLIIATARASKSSRKIKGEKKKHLVTKVETTYGFDTDGDLNIEVLQTIGDLAGEHLWANKKKQRAKGHSKMFEKIVHTNPRIMLAASDMALIRAGVHVLEAPKHIEKALGKMKPLPVASTKRGK